MAVLHWKMSVARCMPGPGRRSWSVGKNSQARRAVGGDRAEAKLIGEMRKPTAAAHVVNLLAHADDNSLQELVELGASIRSAMAKGDDGGVRSLLQGRAAAIAKAMAQARKIARANGESVSGAVGDQIAADVARRDGIGRSGSGSFVVAPSRNRSTSRASGISATSPPPRHLRPRAPPVGHRCPMSTSAPTGRQRKPRHAPPRQKRIKAAAAEVKRVEKALAAKTKRCDGLGRDRDRLASQLAQIDDELTAARAEVDDIGAQLREAMAELDAARGSQPG